VKKQDREILSNENEKIVEIILDTMHASVSRSQYGFADQDLFVNL